MDKQRTILTIDDELTVRQIIRAVLELEGHNVHEAENGVLGLQAARQVKPDIILLDVDMPEMNGHETVRRLKSDEDLRTIPVIMLTGRAKSGDKIEGLGQGADEYVTKPVSGQELTARVNALLRMVDLQNEVFRLEREHQELQMQMAREVQLELLPADLPSVQGLELSLEYHTCDEVGGDFYDLAKVSEQSLMLTFGDAEGHGIGASLLMARAGAYVRAGIESGLSEPAEMLNWANRLICADHGSSALLPVISLSINRSSSQLSYANAGHLPLLLVRAPGNEISMLESTGPLLGIDADMKCEQAETAFETGDVIVCYTDGLTEATDEYEAEFGIDRLQAIVKKRSSESPNYLCREIHAAWANYTKGDVNDDMTLVVIKATSD
ncbi:MAG: fused response regulator/phosphatase [Planctomycetota bacterium]|nr:fused response regulator/phosphatase [Planctomycetota bacterium]